ncbi:MAG: phosphatidate cytidylyltransferase [Elusimicrobia bacterium]|nr:phosphatidate cytidylyltransferase [Elusimicrobiota bacterium]
MLLPRVLAGIVGIPLLLLFIHWGSIPYLAFVTVLSMLGLYEYGLILFVSGRGVQRWIVLLGGGLLTFAVAIGVPGGDGARANLAFMVLSVLVAASMLREMFRKEHSLDRAAISLFGVLFVGWTLAHLVLLRDLRPYGERLTYLLFGAVWITDTTAYFVGRSVGRKPLAAVISPKKTIEGTAAGILGAGLFAVLAERTFLNGALTLPEAAAAGLFIGAMGQASDLAESTIKRAAGVKDSSELLPGHGGILDRFDSFLLTTPILYYALALKFR